MSLHLILKDLRQSSHVIVLAIIGGMAGLALLLIRGQTAFVLGTACFFISMILCGGVLPITNIVNERKRKTLAFMMSLPITAAQYGGAKLLSTLGMFLVPWLTLVAAGLYMILFRHVMPEGTIPTALILATVPLMGFCLVTGIALVGESDGLATAVNVVVNSSYWLAWYLIASQAPALTSTWNSPVPIWNGTAVAVLGMEYAVIAIILALTMLVQSRKRDFL
ncbi:MAG: ABC-2 transporter permease [Alphaproteobacteria bacterium]|nr:ABC-2 transporter permease [Alphaproteobacteria bacterium]